MESLQQPCRVYNINQGYYQITKIHACKEEYMSYGKNSLIYMTLTYIKPLEITGFWYKKLTYFEVIIMS